MFADCLSRLLTEEQHYTVRVQTISEVNRCPPSNGSCPDIALVDSSLGDRCSADVVAMFRSLGVSAIVLLVPDASRQTVHDCILADVSACVLEEAPLDHLLTAINSSLKGDRWFSPEIFNEAIALNRDLALERLPKQQETCQLTAREIEVMQLVAWERLSNKQIAHRLCVSVYTVKNHVHNIIEKLEVTDRFEAADFAARKRWLGLVPSAK